MNRMAQGAVLLLLGTAALRASLTDLHLRYVKESLQPFLLAASLLLIVAGAVTLWYEWRPRWSEPEPEPEPAPTPDGGRAPGHDGGGLDGGGHDGGGHDHGGHGGRSMAGRRVELTGFLVTGEDGQVHLARLVLSCCAADARPIKVGLAGAAPAGLPDDTWVRAVGTYLDRTGVDPINEATIPYLEVEQWQEVPAPRQSYG